MTATLGRSLALADWLGLPGACATFSRMNQVNSCNGNDVMTAP